MSRAEARVHYYPGQFLRPGDFEDEQAYHLAAHRRHNIGHHTWGIVTGLEIVVDPQTGGLMLRPGAAIDGFGRRLIVPDPRPIGAQVFADKGSDLLDVYLNYARTGGEAPPAGYAGCVEGDDAAFYRWSERPLLSFEAGDPTADRRSPPHVLDADRGFDASRTPPDEPQRRWPLFLASIAYDRASTADPFTADLAGRPYVGLAAGSVAAPSGRGRIQIGSERRGDPNRFAVFVPEAETSATAGRPRLAITDAGDVGVLGNTTVEGDLTVDGHGVELLAGSVRPAGAYPAQLYRVIENGEDELRVEMAEPGAQGPERVVIGTWRQGAFDPCLTVANDCTVTVHGDLVVEGAVAQAAFLNASAVSIVDPGLGDEARRLAVASFTTGVTGAASLLGAAYQSPFPKQAPIPLAVAAATAVAASTDQLDVFVDALRRRDPAVVERLQEALGAAAQRGGGAP